MGRMDSKAPRWATVCLVAGVLLMVLSGGGLVTSQALVARYAGAVQTEDLFGDGTAGDTPAAASDVEGPLNLLLVGIDPREPTTPPLADSIMVVHIPKGLNGAYVFSIPRDTYVEIPAFPKAGYQGGHGKINGAMAMGSHVTGQQLPRAVQGFELLSKTITKLTGIRRFDAGAIINFEGFKKVVDAMGGVDLYVDERTRSEHLAPDGSRRPYRPRYRGDEHPYTGPQKVYEVGQHHLKGWEALDFVRQRYGGLKGTDYGRQRHQQQFLKAMAEQALSADVVTNPVKLDKVLTAAGKSLTFNGRGRSVVDFAFALKGLRPGEITMIKLKGGGLMDGGRYQGEQLQAGTEELFAAVAQDRVGEFLLNHPEFINRTK